MDSMLQLQYTKETITKGQSQIVCWYRSAMFGDSTYGVWSLHTLFVCLGTQPCKQMEGDYNYYSDQKMYVLFSTDSVS